MELVSEWKHLCADLQRQLGHATLEFVTDLAHRFGVLARGILQVPVDVALPRDDGAGIAATHRHDDVGPLGVGGVELLRHAIRELGHQLGDLWVHSRRRCRAGRTRIAAASLVQSMRHLRPPGVLLADEEDVHAPSAPRSATIASGTSR